MAEFERDDLEITPELLANFATNDPFIAYETDEKTIEQIREERFKRQEQRKLNRRKKLRSDIMNYFMPTAALVLLVSTVCYMNSLQFGLVVSYNDKQVGVVENAEVLKEATNLIDSKIINKSLDSLENEPQYKVAVVKNGASFNDSAELSSRILQNDRTLEDELCGIFVDDEFIGAAKTKEEAEAVLNSLLESQKKAAKELGDVQSVEFNSSVVTEVGLYAKDSVVDGAELKRRLVENVEISYKLTVLQEQNVKIKYKTDYKVDESKPSGFEKVTKKGQIGEGIATNECVYIDGEKISSEHIKVVATKKPVNEEITVSADSKYAGGKDSDTETSSDTDTDEKESKTDEKSSDKNTDSDKSEKNDAADAESSAQPATPEKTENAAFIFPVQGYITSYFGYEGEWFHKGMDIGAGEGTPIAASAAGTVVNVVFDYGTEGLGCYVTIDHGDGYQTTYAQCSDIYVTVGQQVNQGDIIAAVGSTGDSTGPHLHFRVTQYGEFIDPANVLY